MPRPPLDLSGVRPPLQLTPTSSVTIHQRESPSPVPQETLLTLSFSELHQENSWARVKESSFTWLISHSPKRHSLESWLSSTIALSHSSTRLSAALTQCPDSRMSTTPSWLELSQEDQVWSVQIFLKIMVKFSLELVKLWPITQAEIARPSLSETQLTPTALSSSNTLREFQRRTSPP